MKIDKELLKGSTTMLILKLLENENMYGYQMIKELQKKSESIFRRKKLYNIILGWNNKQKKKILFNYKKGKRFIKRKTKRMESF